MTYQRSKETPVQNYGHSNSPTKSLVNRKRKTNTQTSSVRILLDGLEVRISAIYKPPQVTLTTNDLDLLT